MTDYYKILGVKPQSTEQEIKAAYRKMAKKYHPDVVKDDPVLTQKMYEVQEAYEALGDNEKRKQYDEVQRDRKARPGTKSGKSQTNNSDTKNGSTSPDMGQFEQFFGFQPGKGMDTYRDKKQGAKKPEGPIKPEEMFASFFGVGKR